MLTGRVLSVVSSSSLARNYRSWNECYLNRLQFYFKFNDVIIYNKFELIFTTKSIQLIRNTDETGVFHMHLHQVYTSKLTGHHKRTLIKGEQISLPLMVIPQLASFQTVSTYDAFNPIILLRIRSHDDLEYGESNVSVLLWS